METATALAIAAVVSAAAATAGTVMTVQSANAQAKNARNAAALERQQYEEQQKQALQDAQAQQAAVLRDSQAAASAMVARRAAMGLDPYANTGRVLLDDTLNEASADLETIGANASRVTGQLSYAQQSSSLRTSAAIGTARSQAAAGVVNGIGSLASIGGRYLSASDDRTRSAPTARI